MSTQMNQPLKGLKVITIEQAVSAPFCTSRLADAGADVIKIERKEGDFARGYDTAAGGMSSYFVWLNRGKDSLVLNITSDEGKQELARLLEDADIFVQNLRHGAMARLGFDNERLRQEFPKLIICSISGYGTDGPMVDRKAYDLLIQAESGLCSITGGPDEPARVGISMVDIATGATAYSAILEALIERSTTNVGTHISVSMFDVMADWLTVPLLNYEAGNSPKRVGMAHPSIAPYGTFTTIDNQQLLIAVQNDREWGKLCSLFLEKPELATDERFSTNVARVNNRAATDKVITDRISSLKHKDVIEALLQADIALASVNDMAGLSAHPHLRRITVDTPNGPVSYPAPAAVIDGEQRHYGSVPQLNNISE